ncbi:TonB-dependent receptor plug domain-containing protein [Marinobacterium weihaiense]|uniref:TonB-dependent receptor plug domain-containing protein n=1 Tax=Marinobacterium weihaiense TaxID=2851016 RepID=A0ABS6MBT2_9GAMM|nr:TonB-dependent receptor plug domain-containing protein [Marinobacterium weihaiense]MBV0933763.1 TonB-dependent receptor plug domain-containing protein [Marinobacterium weihaiense]
MRSHHALSPIIIMLTGLSTAVVQAETAEHCRDPQPQTCSQELPSVTITGHELATGVQVIDQVLIEQLPTGEGNLADLLRINPAVDFSRNGRGSANSGVMRPEEFSFHGQAYYQNLFMIDGIGVNNDINPASGSSDYGTPGLTKTDGGSSPQGYYLDVGLLEQVEVYDANVPASFGGFTGGVVSARMKRYDGNDFVDLRYGIQRDEWESFHVDARDQDDFDNASGFSADFTPIYRKDSYHLSAQQGLSDRSGVTLGLSRRTSSFRQTEPDGDKTYFNDRIDNLHTRLDTRWNDRLETGFSLRYAERRHDGITSPVYDAPYVQAHRGIGLGTNLEYHLTGGHTFTLDAGLDRLQDELDSGSNHAFQDAAGGDSGGGFGDNERNQTSLTLAPRLALARQLWGATEHRITLGGELRYQEAHYNRPQDVTIDQTLANGMRIHSTYAKGEIGVDYWTRSLYLDDRIRWRNLNLRAGLRADYNDWLGNLDIAPRLSADWDLFGDGSTRLLAGANRYYGRSFLQYAINDALSGFYTRRVYLPNGAELPPKQGEDTSGPLDLATPYSDELMLGWVQQAGPFNSTLKLVQRDSRNGIRKTKSDDLELYYNSGRSDTLSLTWELDHAEHPLMIGNSATVARLALGWKDSTSNTQGNHHLGESDSYEDFINREPVYYQGKLVDRSDLPAWDYNIPLSVSLSSVTQLPAWNLTWSNFINLRQGGTIARDTRKNTSEGYDVYEDFSLEDLVTVDTKVQWKPRTWANSQGYVMVEVSNLFDQVINTNTSDLDAFSDRYTPGRKVWLEVGMRF